MSVDWGYFRKYEDIIDSYMSEVGEGETKASQAVTAVNKLIYKWYNDGDVYDNVHSGLQGWANDLSSYANWLYKYSSSQPIVSVLESIQDCSSEDDYEDLLADLASLVFDAKYLAEQDELPKVGSIYDARGPFEFRFDDEDDDEYDEDEYDDDFDDYDRSYDGDADYLD